MLKMLTFTHHAPLSIHPSQVKAARQYVDRLLDNGADVPVDEADAAYELTLPEWYDDALFKR